MSDGERRSRISRRRLLAGGAAAAGGLVTTGTLTAGLPADARAANNSASSRSGQTAAEQTGAGQRVTGQAAAEPSSATGQATAPPGQGVYGDGAAVEPFHGVRQAGVATTPQAHAAFVGLDLQKGVGKEALGRLMRLLTDDARRLTQGRGALADTEPELAALPARLTVTFGFGPGLFRAAKVEGGPEQLPGFSVDRLEDRWSGGDLLLQICCDDPVTLAHALRMIVKDTASFTKVRWVQRGFRQTVQRPGLTQRNLMGQLDGTVNPKPGTPEFERAVWIADGPLAGGTMLVLRRIRMLMDSWDAADRVAKEFTVGRRLDNGAPLSGRAEHDEADFAKVNTIGFPVISEYAHIRRAHTQDPGLRMFRRVYNYDDGDTGLLFASYQADVARQFTPVQRRLAKADLLNEWTTPIGSAVFYIPPGCEETGWVGQSLLA
ncbi:Dyp-type peroxidase [Nonomuraea endophytica]|uniref:Dyp-type peroxidase n=1 Tax=Nonomuraea endophytica TaxID=714136 RepID=UPI0037CCADB2